MYVYSFFKPKSLNIFADSGYRVPTNAVLFKQEKMLHPKYGFTNMLQIFSEEKFKGKF